MAKKKKEEQRQEVVVITNDKPIAKLFGNEIERDVRYSLEVDPTNKFNMCDEQKQFIKNYSITKLIPVAAKMTKIDEDRALEWFSMYSSQEEIKRLNMAMLIRRTHSKILSYEELEAYVSTTITDEHVPLADRLSTRDKLGAIRLLMDIRDKKIGTIVDNKVDEDSVEKIEQKLGSLSIDVIKGMLTKLDDNDVKSKEELIEQIAALNDSLTIEEKRFLHSLSIDELLSLLEKGGTN